MEAIGKTEKVAKKRLNETAPCHLQTHHIPGSEGYIVKEADVSDDEIAKPPEQFDEIAFDFAEDCFQISLAALQTLSDSDLDSDTHSQHPHDQYTVGDCTASDTEKCDDCRTFELQKREWEAARNSEASSSTDLQSRVGDFTDLMSLLNHTCPQSPETEPKAEADSLATDQASKPESKLPSVIFLGSEISAADVDSTEIKMGKLLGPSVFSDDTASEVSMVSSASDTRSYGSNSTSPPTGSETEVDDNLEVLLTLLNISPVEHFETGLTDYDQALTDLTDNNQDEVDEEDLSVSFRQNIDECQICLDIKHIEPRSCCQFKICYICFSKYLETKVSQSFVLEIQCPSNECNIQLSDYEISTNLPRNLRIKYHRFLTDARNDPTKKTCPRCGHQLHVDKNGLKKKSTTKKGLPVTCQACSLLWCFRCHAPWHEGSTCKEYRKGDEEFQKWTRERDEESQQQVNAQKCPTCKIYIQRKSGCPHMTCSRCSTEFCYECGKRYYLTRTGRRVFRYRLFRYMLGSHNSRLSPLGCRRNFLPESTAGRRLIRGSVLGAKVLGGVGVLAIGAGAAVVVLGVGTVALPIWGAVKLGRKVRDRRHSARNS